MITFLLPLHLKRVAFLFHLNVTENIFNFIEYVRKEVQNLPLREIILLEIYLFTVSKFAYFSLYFSDFSVE